ncbi:MAG TPA: hypothetical protein VJQ56_16555 [Blastocatellia bacterium]|nr:hypothetical protein [Blastocatellia bacterium]
MVDGRKVHQNALPNYQNAKIPRGKIEGYVLDPLHPVGKNKALVFKRALGLNQSNWEILLKAIMDELPYHEAVIGKVDKYGQRYSVTIPITGPNGKAAQVITGWIVETGATYPSLATARVR